MGEKELLVKYIEEIESPIPKIPISKKNDEEDIDKKIKKTNAWIAEKAERQKIKLRDKLTKTVTRFIWVQLIFFNFVVALIVLCVTINIGIFKEVDNELAKLLFNFLKYYISATIVELLSMLGFILHYVFSINSTLKKVRKED